MYLVARGKLEKVCAYQRLAEKYDLEVIQLTTLEAAIFSYLQLRKSAGREVVPMRELERVASWSAVQRGVKGLEAMNLISKEPNQHRRNLSDPRYLIRLL
jgi:DNA-binding MarR family transcriptional regulator